LSVSGRSSSSSTALEIGQVIAVRAAIDSGDKFWLGKICRVLHANVQLQWYDKGNNNTYKLMSANHQNKVCNSAILCTKISFSPTGTLTKEAHSCIKKVLK
jgi:hypothetical protein